MAVVHLAGRWPGYLFLWAMAQWQSRCPLPWTLGIHVALLEMEGTVQAAERSSFGEVLAVHFLMSGK